MRAGRQDVVWSDPSVDLDGLLPDEALLRLAMLNTARRLRLPGYEENAELDRRMGGRFARAVSDLFGHGAKYAAIMCARFGFDPETGEDLWRRMYK